MTEREALIRDLKEAPKGSLVLDSRIAVLEGWRFEEWWEPASKQGGAKVRRCDWYNEKGQHTSWPRRYTTSFDGAITLVRKTEGGNLAGFLHAIFWQRGIGDIPDDRLILTLCIAAIEAWE